MKKINDPNTIIKYRGMLCEITSIALSKVLFIKEVGAKPCVYCGETKIYAEVESSPNFQERAEAVKTLEE